MQLSSRFRPTLTPQRGCWVLLLDSLPATGEAMTLLPPPRFLCWFLCSPEGATPFRRSLLNWACACLKLRLTLWSALHSGQFPLCSGQPSALSHLAVSDWQPWRCRPLSCPGRPGRQRERGGERGRTCGQARAHLLWEGSPCSPRQN